MNATMRTGRLLLAAAVVAAGMAFAPTLALANAVVTIVNNDGAGEGFNDPTPAAPVGGNTGTTIGQQRLKVFQAAAAIWGSKLDSNVPIVVRANFDPLTCTASSAVLGSAGAANIYSDFTHVGSWPGPEFAGTWYSSAEADKRAGTELAPGLHDIAARFNSSLGTSGCLSGTFWYYGLDGNHGNNVDLLAVVLHELGHGLGFQPFASLSSGAQPDNLTDVFARRLLDRSTGKTWNQMSDGERVASASNTRNVVWNGPVVSSFVSRVLALGTPVLRVNAPAGIAGDYEVGTATFGAQLSSPGVTGVLELVNDGVASSSTTDACEPLVGFTPGHIALIDRGTCNFAVKAKMAQDAGAIAVIIADNVAGSPPTGLGGSDPTVTIPAVRVTLDDGNTLRAALAAGVNATLTVDPTIRAGADPAGKVLMFTPNPVQPGSSIAHWDPLAFPNLLMEPAITPDLTHQVNPPQDLTLAAMRDIGWFADKNLDGIPDATDPLPVALPNLSVQRSGGGAALLRWEADALRDYAGIGVYRQLPGQSRVAISQGTLLDTATYEYRDAAAPAGGADYWLAAVTLGGSEAWFGPATLAATAASGIRLAVQSNPFHPGSTIAFTLADARAAELVVYTVSGRQVATLASGILGAGNHTLRWDGRGADGREVAAGVYVMRLRAGNLSRTEKFVLMR